MPFLQMIPERFQKKHLYLYSMEELRHLDWDALVHRIENFKRGLWSDATKAGSVSAIVQTLPSSMKDGGSKP
jgi:hypothetical protein